MADARPRGDAAAKRPPRLADVCRAAADRWQRTWPAAEVFVGSPFVVVGDCHQRRLKGWWEQVILPTADQLLREFQWSAPRRPVVILWFSTRRGYEAMAERQFGQPAVSPLSLFKPSVRTIMVNGESGQVERALRHELTHALLHADFPQAPRWLQEGLAGLYEVDWSRQRGLLQAPQRFLSRPSHTRRVLRMIQAERLPPLSRLVADRRVFQGRGSQAWHAYARSFCQFLRETGHWPAVYRALQAGLGVPPCSDSASRGQLESEFRHWVMSM